MEINTIRFKNIIIKLVNNVYEVRVEIIYNFIMTKLHSLFC